MQKYTKNRQFIGSILLLLLWLETDFFLSSWLCLYKPSLHNIVWFLWLSAQSANSSTQSCHFLVNPITFPLRPTSEVPLHIEISLSHTEFLKWNAHNGCPGSTSQWLVYHFALCEYKILYERSLRVTSWTQSSHCSVGSPDISNPGWGQFAEEPLITVAHAPIDVINQVNEAQCQ